MSRPASPRTEARGPRAATPAPRRTAPAAAAASRPTAEALLRTAPPDGLQAVLAAAVQRREHTARLDRMVTKTGAEGERAVLEPGYSDAACAETLAHHLVTTQPIEKTLGFEVVEREILLALAKLRGQIQPLLEAPERTALDVVGRMALDAIRRDRPRDVHHAAWYASARQEYEQALGVDARGLLKGDTLRTHEEASADPMLAHYAALDIAGPDVLWRFTSRPRSEEVKIDAGVPFSKVVELVGAHSGGNRKDDPSVRTLSFGRNLGALIGTAHSRGGDAGVAGIVVRAEYLYGVPIASLKGTGITAHPAESRLISLFESEYVLVATPGDAPRTLEELATIKLRNPFKSGDPNRALLAGKGLVAPKEDAPKPEEPSGKLGVMPPNARDAVVRAAKEFQAAATPLAPFVQNKDFARRDDIESTMRAYHRALGLGGPSRQLGSIPSQPLAGRSLTQRTRPLPVKTPATVNK